jgi:tetratricopeptide (TPR) repeat protein
MLDVPALALNLLALVVFIRAVERDSLALATFSGIVVGLALETKYTGFLGLGALGLYSLVAGKWRLGFVSCLLGVCLFGLWEGFVQYRYGISVFLFHVQIREEKPWEEISLVLPMLSFVGGLAAVLIPLGLAARYRSRGLLLLASGLIIGIFACIVFIPAGPLKAPSGGLPVWQDWIARNGYPFTVMGLVIFLLAGVILGRLWKAACEDGEKASVWFLSLWLVLEVVGVFALSPFMAARRVIEVTVVLALVFGRLASITIKTPDWRPWLHALVGFNLLLGIGYSSLDYWEAETERKTVQEAAHSIRQRQPDATIWYTGYGGVQFYAEEEGMRQVIPSVQPFAMNQQLDHAASWTPSTLHEGDWLIVPDERITQQGLVQLTPPDQDLLEIFEPIVARDAVHVRTVLCYYCGLVPLRHEEGPRFVLNVFRVKKDFVAEGWAFNNIVLAHWQAAEDLLARGQVAEAIIQYTEALRLEPDFSPALNNLAWIRAANPQPEFRNGGEAVRLAERACQLTEYKQPMLVGTLAAAYAEAGRFEDAVATAEKACALATRNGEQALLAKNRQLLELYRAGRPYHEPAAPIQSPPASSRP